MNNLGRVVQQVLMQIVCAYSLLISILKLLLPIGQLQRFFDLANFPI
jgi:hypothetical protein